MGRRTTPRGSEHPVPGRCAYPYPEGRFCLHAPEKGARPWSEGGGCVEHHGVPAASASLETGSRLRLELVEAVVAVGDAVDTPATDDERALRLAELADFLRHAADNFGEEELSDEARENWDALYEALGEDFAEQLGKSALMLDAASLRRVADSPDELAALHDATVKRVEAERWAEAADGVVAHFAELNGWKYLGKRVEGSIDENDRGSLTLLSVEDGLTWDLVLVSNTYEIERPLGRTAAGVPAEVLYYALRSLPVGGRQLATARAVIRAHFDKPDADFAGGYYKSGSCRTCGNDLLFNEASGWHVEPGDRGRCPSGGPHIPVPAGAPDTPAGRVNALSDKELIEEMARLIAQDQWTEGDPAPMFELVAAECQRRTPNYHLYTRAHNEFLLNSGERLGPADAVPPDPRTDPFARPRP